MCVYIYIYYMYIYIYMSETYAAHHSLNFLINTCASVLKQKQKSAAAAPGESQPEQGLDSPMQADGDGRSLTSRRGSESEDDKVRPLC
jgi:hypothetical protein